MSYSSAPPESRRALLGGAREEEEDTEVSAELYGEGQHRAQVMRSPAFDGEELLFASSSAVARRGGAREWRGEAPSSSRALSDDELEERSSSRLRGAQTNLRKRSSRDHGDAFKFLRTSSRLRRQPPALDAPLLGRAHRQRFVALPDDEMERVVGVYHRQVDAGGASDPFSFSPEHRRCTCVCCCEKFDLEKVHSLFKDGLRATIALKFIEAVYVSGVAIDQGGALAHSSNAYIFFSYGVVLIWGSCDPLEAAILKMTEPAMVEPHEIERDVFSYQYNSAVKSYIQNDVISIGRADNTNEKIKMAISHALAQSTKMSVLEVRTLRLRSWAPERSRRWLTLHPRRRTLAGRERAGEGAQDHYPDPPDSEAARDLRPRDREPHGGE